MAQRQQTASPINIRDGLASRHSRRTGHSPTSTQWSEIAGLRRRLNVDGRPNDLSDLGQRLRLCLDEPESALAVVADYAMKRPFDVAFGTVRAIAAACEVSSTSVMRLAATVGFDSFKDMQNFYREPLRKSPLKREF